MPAVEKKQLLMLTPNEVQQVLKACLTLRDRMIILLLADSGIRKAEACALNWGDVNFECGLIRVLRGKGGKYRRVVIGDITRQILLDYRETGNHGPHDPLIQTRTGTRMTLSGMQSVFMRISERAGLKVTPHALRRTFATLSHRAGMDLLELQALMGHASLEMTKHYIHMLDDDLLEAHKEHGPVDKYLRGDCHE
jgi:integrase/recombinase XerD